MIAARSDERDTPSSARQLRLRRAAARPAASSPVDGSAPRSSSASWAQRPARGGHGATTTFSTSPARIAVERAGRLVERDDVATTTQRMPPSSRASMSSAVHLVAVARRVRAVHLHLLVVEDVRREAHVRRALRQAAEEQHAPARRGHLHRLLLGDVARAGDDHDVGAEAVGRRAHRGDAVGVARCRGRPCGRRRAIAVARARAGSRARLEQQHLAGALQPGERARARCRPGRRRSPRRVVEADADVLVAADRVRQRVGERRVRGATARRGCGTGSCSAIWGIATRSA